MAHAEVFRLPTCLACAGPARAHAILCQECTDAFRLARGIHPSTTRIAADDEDVRSQTATERLDVWDEWALLGDVGDTGRRSLPD